MNNHKICMYLRELARFYERDAEKSRSSTYGEFQQRRAEDVKALIAELEGADKDRLNRLFQNMEDALKMQEEQIKKLEKYL